MQSYCRTILRLNRLEYLLHIYPYHSPPIAGRYKTSFSYDLLPRRCSPSSFKLWRNNSLQVGVIFHPSLCFHPPAIPGMTDDELLVAVVEPISLKSVHDYACVSIESKYFIKFDNASTIFITSTTVVISQPLH